MKKAYLAPSAEVVKFEAADVITTSGHDGCEYQDFYGVWDD